MDKVTKKTKPQHKYQNSPKLKKSGSRTESEMYDPLDYGSGEKSHSKKSNKINKRK